MITKRKTCIDCESAYEKEVSSPRIKISSRCDNCRTVRERSYKDVNYKVRQKAVMKAWRLKNIHGISQEDIDKLLKSQNFVCRICGEDITTRYVIDHDHNCCPVPSGGNGNVRRCGKCIRGLLCSPCNSILGYSRDDTSNLEGAIRYLKEWEGVKDARR